MVPKVQLHWICISTLFFVENLASSFVMPTYDYCDGMVYLDSNAPAAKLTIRPYSRSPQSCLTRVRTTTGFKIGVLVPDLYSAVECPPETCTCILPPFYFYFSQYVSKRFCHTSYKGVLDTDIETYDLDILYNTTNNLMSIDYNLVVFRFSKYCRSFETRTQCPYTSRCIDDKLLCKPPFKFCGDESDLCVAYPENDSNSTSGVIPGLVVTSIALILVGIVCYMCLGRGRMCRGTRDSRGDSREDVRTAAREVFTVQLTTRGVPSNRPDTGTDNTAYTEDPPDYDSLNITDLGSSSDAEIKDELPPCYDHVMSNTNDYKVNSSATN